MSAFAEEAKQNQERHEAEIACLRSSVWHNYSKSIRNLLYGLAAFAAVARLADIAFRLAVAS